MISNSTFFSKPKRKIKRKFNPNTFYKKSLRQRDNFVNSTKTDDIIRYIFDDRFKSLEELNLSFFEFIKLNYKSQNEYDYITNLNNKYRNYFFPNGDNNNYFELYYTFILLLIRLVPQKYSEYHREILNIYISLKEDEKLNFIDPNDTVNLLDFIEEN